MIKKLLCCLIATFLLSIIFPNHTLLAQGTWTQKASFSGGGRVYSTYFAVKGKGYIGFGDYTNPNDLWEFDPATNAWTQRASIPGESGRAEMLGFAIGNYGYVGLGLSTTGQDDNGFWKFDPSSNTWSAIAFWPDDWTRGAFAFVIGNDAYVGSGSADTMTHFWKYNLVNNAWTRKNNIPTAAVRYFGIGFAIGNKGYAAIGVGADGSTAKNDLWEYNPDTDSWTQKANFGGGIRVNAVGFASASKGYIATGHNNLGSYFNDFWEYNPGTDTWTQKANYPGPGLLAGAGFSIGCHSYLGLGDTPPPGFIPQSDFWQFTNDAASSLYVTADTTICPGNPVALTANGGVSYLWSPSTGLNTINGATVIATPNNSIAYTVTDTSISGCNASATVNITISSGDTASVSIQANPTGTVCAGTPITFTALPVNGGNPLYQWKVGGLNTGTNNSVFTSSSLSDSNIITCIMTSTANCVSGSPATSNSIIVNIAPGPAAGTITASSDTICTGSPVHLVDGGSSGSIQWLTSLNGTSFTNIAGASSTTYDTSSLTETTYYFVTASGSCGTDTSNTVKIFAAPLPAPILSATDSICPGDSTQICEVTAFSGYHWNTGDSTSCTWANQAGGYWVIVTDANGCIAVSEHQNVLTYSTPQVSITVHGDTLSTVNAVSSQWLLNDTIIPGATSNIYIAHETGNYSVRVADANGCTNESIATRIVISGIAKFSDDADLKIYPNPASSILVIQAKDFSAAEILVFDVTGKLVMKEKFTPQLNISDLQSGIYLIELQSNFATARKNFLKL